MLGATIVLVAFLVSLLAITVWITALIVASIRRWIPVGSTKIRQSDRHYTDAQILRAIEVYLDVFEDIFGPNLAVEKECWSVRIVWHFAEDFEVNTGNPVRAYGWNPSGNLIHVATRNSDNLAYTAFFHELIHVTLRVTAGGPDPDHMGDAYPGWTEDHILLERESKRIYAAWYAEQKALEAKEKGR